MGVTLLLAMAAATPAPSPARPAVSAQATATVRIVNGAAIRFGQSANAGSWTLTRAQVRVEDGSHRPARLIEFQ